MWKSGWWVCFEVLFLSTPLHADATDKPALHNWNSKAQNQRRWVLPRLHLVLLVITMGKRGQDSLTQRQRGRAGPMQKQCPVVTLRDGAKMLLGTLSANVSVTAKAAFASNTTMLSPSPKVSSYFFIDITHFPYALFFLLNWVFLSLFLGVKFAVLVGCWNGFSRG